MNRRGIKPEHSSRRVQEVCTCVNLCSKGYAGNARFLCINELADFIEKEKVCKCRFAGFDNAINKDGCYEERISDFSR